MDSAKLHRMKCASHLFWSWIRMTDILSGHTAAQNTLGADGLRDGDALSTATLTNAVQALHGNGILRLEDGAYGSTRNATNGQPGAMVKHSDAWKLTVTGGYVALDGVLYEFANGPGGTATLVLGDGTDGSGGIALASSSEEALYVIYAASDGGEFNVHYEGGSPVNTANGLYPVASSAYLTDYNTGASQSNMKTIVLAVVRVKGGGGGAHSVDIQEINDKRVFLPPSVRYMAPLSLGAIASNKVATTAGHGINTIAHLNTLQSEVGDIAADGSDSITALWPSHPRYGAIATVQTAAGSGDSGYGHGPSRGADIATNHVKNALYFAGRNNEGTSHYSVRLDGRGVEATQTVIAGSITVTLTADGDSFLMLKVANSQTVTLNPARDASSKYMFPEGHIIEVCNDSAGTGIIVFDNQSTPTGLNASLSPSHRATFIYEGSKWMRCDYQSAIIASGTITALTGDVTASGSGSVAATIAADAVITTKILDANVTTAKIADDAVTEDKIDNTLLAEIDANTAKATNVATNLSISGTTGARTIESSDGTNATIPIATTSVAGVMSKAIFDEHTANVAKATNVVTNLSISGSTGARTIESSDGTNAIIPVATTSVSGVMSNAIFDAVTANTAKATNVATNLTGTTHASQLTIVSSDGTDVVIAEASGSIAGVMTVAHHDKLDAIAASATAFSAANAITAVEGEATLALAGQVTLRAGIEVCTSDPAPAIAESGTVYQFTKGSAGVFTLPVNPTVGTQFVLVNATANDIVITPQSGDKINGATANKTNTTAYAATSIICAVGGGSAEWLAFGGI